MSKHLHKRKYKVADEVWADCYGSVSRKIMNNNLQVVGRINGSKGSNAFDQEEFYLPNSLVPNDLKDHLGLVRYSLS